MISQFPIIDNLVRDHRSVLRILVHCAFAVVGVASEDFHKKTCGESRSPCMAEVLGSHPHHLAARASPKAKAKVIWYEGHLNSSRYYMIA